MDPYMEIQILFRREWIFICYLMSLVSLQRGK